MSYFHDARLATGTCTTCSRPVYGRRRKCVECAKPGKVTVLRESRAGRNRTGIAAHKPDKPHTRKAKRQNPPQGGPRPVTAYRPKGAFGR